MCHYKSRRYYLNRLIFTPLRFQPPAECVARVSWICFFLMQSTGIRRKCLISENRTRSQIFTRILLLLNLPGCWFLSYLCSTAPTVHLDVSLVVHKGLLLPHIKSHTLQGCAVKNGAFHSVMSAVMNASSKQDEWKRDEWAWNNHTITGFSISSWEHVLPPFLCCLLDGHLIKALNLNTHNPTVATSSAASPGTTRC